METKLYTVIPRIAIAQDHDSSLLMSVPLGKHRSFVRRISSWLPVKEPKRMKFQQEFLQSTRISSSLDSDSFGDESGCQMWYTPARVTLADIVWLTRDEGEPGIKLRTQLYGMDPLTASTPLPTRTIRRTNTSQCGAHGHGPSDTFEYQTPVRSVMSNNCNSIGSMTPIASFQTPDKAALEKISQLEQELLLLRQQLASMAVAQDQMGNSTNVSTGSANCSSVFSASTPAPSSTIPAPPPPCVPPPPPPLPPPPPPPPPIISEPQASVIDLIKQRRNQSKGSDVTGKKGNRPDFSEVLKGLGTVKLRAIKRSPGGTPVRQKPKPIDPKDPAALIANALRKKFAHCQTRSPESDKENTCSSTFSPSPHKRARRTPDAPGPHLLKPSQRRQFKRRSNQCSHSLLSDINDSNSG